MKSFLLLLLLSCSFVLVAQNEYEDLSFVSLKNKAKLDRGNKAVSYKFSFLSLAAGAEFYIAPKFSLDASLRLSANLIFNGAGTSPSLIFAPFPILHVEPKWNYNIKKRESLGKKTTHFSSNFLSLFVSYRAKVSANTNNSLLIGPTWGLQRNFGKIGYVKFNTGIGYQHTFSNTGAFLLQSTVIPILDLQLGIQF